MANVHFPNFTLQSANHAFSAIWKLTRALKKAGWTVQASSDGASKDTSAVAANDKWGGDADPANDTYVTTNLDATYSSTTGPWIVLSTPTTSKIPFSAASTGTFLRGEKITQATSGAEGELVGYDFDAVSVGHLVIIPRTGTFDNTNVITGVSSGATLTPSGTIVNFVREVCFWKSGVSGANNAFNGSIYIQTVDVSSENTSRFSYLAVNSAGCTATVCPGGGGTANGIPSLGTYVMLGTTTGGTSPTITHSTWLGMTTSTFGRAQITATNAIPAANVSPDLTWWIVMGDTTSAIGAQMIGHFRCDNSEDGDLDPFVTYITAVGGTTTRIAAPAGSLTTAPANFFPNITGSSFYGWKGWRRRGFSTGDAYTGLCTALLGFSTGGTGVMINNPAVAESIACSNTTKRLRDKVWILSIDNTLKIRKGTPRWIDVCQSGAPMDTLDTKLRLCFIGFAGSYPSVYIGPFDGSTIPLQS